MSNIRKKIAVLMSLVMALTIYLPVGVSAAEKTDTEKTDYVEGEVIALVQTSEQQGRNKYSVGTSFETEQLMDVTDAADSESFMESAENVTST